TVIVSLEDYGFCAKGEGGPFVAEQVTGQDGGLAINTGGGQLSSFYMWGMTPVSEAVIQVRGEGGKRQGPKPDLALGRGNGGVFPTHSPLALSRHPSCRLPPSRYPRSHPRWLPSGRRRVVTSWWSSAVGAAATSAFRHATSAAAASLARSTGSRSQGGA